jgi:hypothetical protein
MQTNPHTPNRAGRGARKLVLAVSAAAALGALALPATGQAATVFGSNLKHDAEVGGGQELCSPAPSPCTHVAYRYPDQDPQVQGSPVDGVVTKFRLKSQTTDPVTFRLARIEETTTGALATGAGTGPTVALKGDNSIEEFDARVPIHVGDHLALDGAVVSAQYANDGGRRHYVYGSPLEDGGAQRDASDHSSKQLLVQVTIEPDADKDGFGDQTQDGCPSQPATSGACDNGAPILSGLALAPGSFRASGAGFGAVASRAPIGSRVFYELSEDAKLTLGVEKGIVGRKAFGGKCVKTTKRNKGRKHCVRFVKLAGSSKVTGKAGHNGFRLSGRWNGRKLGVGSYRLVAVARDVVGNVSREQKRNFRIVR